MKGDSTCKEKKNEAEKGTGECWQFKMDMEGFTEESLPWGKKWIRKACNKSNTSL